MELHIPNLDELAQAHETFERREPRHRDYWLALEGVEKGFRSDNLSDVASSVAGLLKSWHREFYRWRPTRKTALETELRHLIMQHFQSIISFRGRSLSGLAQGDRATVLKLFSSFEEKLGPVGSAKALNLVAPSFFPLWDNAVAYGYGVVLAAHGYFLFMVLVKDQITRMSFPEGLEPLKTLDEYNYCKYTQGWIC